MKNEMNEDRRVIRTRRDLRAAMNELLQKKSFDKININDICTLAMVNRMTFYNHYKDKYELLRDVILELRETILQKTQELRPQISVNSHPIIYFETLTRAITDELLLRKNIIVALINNETSLTMFSEILKKSFYNLYAMIAKQYKPRYPISMISVGITGMLSALFKEWLIFRPEENKESFLRETNNFFRELFSSNILFETH